MQRLLLLFFLSTAIMRYDGNAQIVHNIYDTLCSGDVLYGYNTTGIYRDTFRVGSTDSIRVLDLTVIPRIGAAPLPRWFNTGTNGSGGTLPALSPDSRWRVSTNMGGPYNPAVVMSYVPPNYSASAWPDCAWISHQASTPGSHSGNMIYYYRIDFLLPCFDSCGSSFNTDSVFCLMLDILVDNSVQEVYVNGVPQSASLGGVIPVANPYGYVGFQNAQKLSLTLCSGWKRGYNSLIVQIASGAPYAGFLAQASVNAPPPPPAVQASFDIDPVVGGASSAVDTGCAPFTVHFLNSSVSATGFIWDFGDGSPQSNVDSPTHTYHNPGAYTVTLIASSALCGLPDTLQKVIMVYDYPVVNLGPDTVLCSDAILLQSKPPYTDVGYLWNSGATTPSWTATQSGSYWLEIDRYGCAARDSIDLVLNYAVQADLGNDTGICDRDQPLILYANQPPGAHLLWSNGLSDTLMEVVRTGVYWLHVALNGCESSDTIRVTMVPTPVVDLGPDSIICEQFPLRIGWTVPGAMYSWNTGEETSHTEVSATNDYVLTINLDGCIVRDTIGITAMPEPVVELNDQDICPEQTIILDATYRTGSTYSWNTGEITPGIAVQSAGTYWVKIVSEHRCIGNDTVLLTFYPKPVVMLGPDTVVCEETPLVLVPFRINADSLYWSDGSVENTLMIRHGGEYIVTAVNKCGLTMDTIGVRQRYCDIMIPDAFTPNGDAKNDVFRVLGNVERMEGFRLTIFNRWGRELFHTQDRRKGWDGIYNGHAMGVDTYVYMLEYSIEGAPYLRKGNFHLIR